MHKNLTLKDAIKFAEPVFCKTYIECCGCGGMLEGTGDTPSQAKKALRDDVERSNWLLVGEQSEGFYPCCPNCADGAIEDDEADNE